jgi:hypothetical protein
MQNPALKSKVMNFINSFSHSVSDSTNSAKDSIENLKDKASS